MISELELSKRLHIGHVRNIASLADNDPVIFTHIFEKISNSDIRVGYNALWILTHCTILPQFITPQKANEIIDWAMSEPHTGKRRLMLTILEAISPEFRSDFFDYCLQKSTSRHEAYGVRSLCLKLAYSQALQYPELLEELILIIDFISCEPLSPGLQSTIRNIKKKLKP